MPCGIEAATRTGDGSGWWTWRAVDISIATFDPSGIPMAWALRTGLAMRVQVVVERGRNGSQAGAYAEYRLFKTLARYGSLVHGAQIVLRHEGGTGPRAFRCRMTVSLEPTGTVRASVGASHAYAAIDQAADRIGHLIHRRGARPVTS